MKTSTLLLIPLLAIAAPLALAQTAPEPVAVEKAAANTKPGKDKSMLDIYNDGGIWMHPILLTSIAAVAVSVLCFLQITRARILPTPLLSTLNTMMAERQLAEAFNLCRSQNSTLANVMSSALLKANFDAPMFNKTAMEAAASEALYQEETKLGVLVNYLNVCAQIAPMLGLFGTVVGMIESFNLLAAGKAEAADLASGIGVAMITTAGGLIVAIPAMAVYFIFRGMLTSLMTDTQKQASRLLDLFTGEMTPDGNRPPSYAGTLEQPR